MLALAEPGEVVQFERLGYFARDPEASAVMRRGRPPAHRGSSDDLFHRTVGLRDEWANIQKWRASRG